jgi:hypothetical protein
VNSGHNESLQQIKNGYINGHVAKESKHRDEVAQYRARKPEI